MSIDDSCFHCGDSLPKLVVNYDAHNFCCEACKNVYLLLGENDLLNYYSLESSPGFKQELKQEKFEYLKNEKIAIGLLQFQDESISKIQVSLPQIHCASCIYLLENLNRIHHGVITCSVNFTSRKALVTFDHNKMTLFDLSILLSDIGYVPEFTKEQEEDSSKKNSHFKIWKIGVAGFCFGNIMLMSLPEYFGFDSVSSGYKLLFRYLNLLLVLPVVFFSGYDYFKNAFRSVYQRRISIEVPVVIGVVALFLRSIYEVFYIDQSGYFDSLAGFLFFLLLGKYFQDKIFDALHFERNFKSFLPIAVLKKSDGEFFYTPIENLTIGDEIQVKTSEIFPCDCELISGKGTIDNSFITGESKEQMVGLNDSIFAGAKNTGGLLNVRVKKDVNQSYLTQLWNSGEVKNEILIESLSNKIAPYFTIATLIFGIIAFVFWYEDGVEKSVEAMTAVLIVACPCALALSAPLVLGNGIRYLSRIGLYLKNTEIIEKLAKVTTIFWDKTGTLTEQNSLKVTCDTGLDEENKIVLSSLFKQSNHPLSRGVLSYLNCDTELPVSELENISGQGMKATVDGKIVLVGSSVFVTGDEQVNAGSTLVFASIDGKIYRFSVVAEYRSGLLNLIKKIQKKYRSFLISGDNNSEAVELEKFFGDKMVFDCKPANKSDLVKSTKEFSLMLGDGMNDTNALQSATVGIAVADDINTFFPGCDGVIKGDALINIEKILNFTKASLRLVYLCFFVSILYNLVGVYLAINLYLSPLFAAILMPVSSISILLISYLGTHMKFRSIFKPDLDHNHV